MSEIKEQKLPTSFSGDIYVKIEFKSLDIDLIYKKKKIFGSTGVRDR